MNVKNAILIIVTVVFFQRLTAQFSIAGNTVGIYTNSNDTLLEGSSNDNFYYVDINQDGVKDLRFGPLKKYYPSTQTLLYWVGISSNSLINGNVFLDSNIVKFSVAYKSSCYNINMLKSYNYGDTISRRGNYVALGTYLAFDDGVCADRTFSNNAYIGVRYSTNVDTAYGWIGVDVLDYGTVRVKDFALEKNPMVGIKEYERDDLQLIIYPNPAQRQVYGKSSEAEISEIKIITITGSEVINTKQNVIDVSGLPNGIYFVQVKTDKGIGTRKIVVQK